jgi:hypothetical protein
MDPDSLWTINSTAGDRALRQPVQPIQTFSLQPDPGQTLRHSPANL